jgi:hypothetical protein
MTAKMTLFAHSETLSKLYTQCQICLRAQILAFKIKKKSTDVRAPYKMGAMGQNGAKWEAPKFFKLLFIY